jgi:hypothetical protein
MDPLLSAILPGSPNFEGRRRWHSSVRQLCGPCRSGQPAGSSTAVWRCCAIDAERRRTESSGGVELPNGKGRRLGKRKVVSRPDGKQNWCPKGE